MSNKFTISLQSEPVIEPVTVAEVKQYAHIDYDTEDDIILKWIKTARIKAENYQRRAYIRQTWHLIFDKFPSMPIYVPRPPLVNVKSVKYYDFENTEKELNLADNFYIDYDSEPGRIDFAYSILWPAVTLRNLNALIIRYVAGYNVLGEETTTTESPDRDLIPADVKEAIFIYCTFRNDNRSAEEKLPDQFYNILYDNRVSLSSDNV